MVILDALGCLGTHGRLPFVLLAVLKHVAQAARFASPAPFRDSRRRRKNGTDRYSDWMTISIMFFLAALFSVITTFHAEPRVLGVTLLDMFAAAAHFADRASGAP